MGKRGWAKAKKNVLARSLAGESNGREIDSANRMIFSRILRNMIGWANGRSLPPPLLESSRIRNDFQTSLIEGYCALSPRASDQFSTLLDYSTHYTNSWNTHKHNEYGFTGDLQVGTVYARLGG